MSSSDTTLQAAIDRFHDVFEVLTGYSWINGKHPSGKARHVYVEQNYEGM